jgi:hypothetical protein
MAEFSWAAGLWGPPDLVGRVRPPVVAQPFLVTAAGSTVVANIFMRESPPLAIRGFAGATGDRMNLFQ